MNLKLLVEDEKIGSMRSLLSPTNTYTIAAHYFIIETLCRRKCPHFLKYFLILFFFKTMITDSDWDLHELGFTHCHVV